jgi:DNA replication and repair protein RecF
LGVIFIKFTNSLPKILFLARNAHVVAHLLKKKLLLLPFDNVLFRSFATMFIQSLSLVNFRNHSDAEFHFVNGVNCIVGRNGAGKTNVLDAVHYLSMCRSYLNPIDRQNVQFNEPFFVIQGDWMKNEQSFTLYCGVKIGAKKVFKKNKKEYDRLADHIGQFPVVMISPYDADLISEGSEVRRRWMDGIISQFDRTYLEQLQRYNKVVEQRNALLKQNYENGFFSRESIEIWDDQLVRYGKAIHEKRVQFLTAFIPLFQHYYQWISSNQEVVTMSYESSLNDTTLDQLLKDAFPKDSRVQYTSVGTHRDDVGFLIEGQPIKKFGSQGQQKSFLIALRLAQFDWLKNRLSIAPVLLLDDIFDKLDNFRVAQLMSLVSQNTFGQVLVTDTDEIRVSGIFQAIGVTPHLILFDSADNEQGVE